jgi:hypothetical protein
MLTKKIREVPCCRIEMISKAPAPDFTKMIDPNARHLVDEVSIKETVVRKG